MLFIKNGIQMVAVKEGAILKIRPNPNFVRKETKYGSLLLNDDVIGVYPLTKQNEYDQTLYDVWQDLSTKISNGNTLIDIPIGYKFESYKEYEEYIEMAKSYDLNAMFEIFYSATSAAGTRV